MMVNISNIKEVLHKALFRDIGEIFGKRTKERKAS